MDNVSRPQRQCYSSGEAAIQLDADGCGFCYYESGRVAVCAIKVSDYQRCFQFYGDNQQKTLLGSIDQHAVGTLGNPKGTKLLLSREGGMLLDKHNDILKNWKWNGSEGGPAGIKFQLNDKLTLTYKNRRDIDVKFAPCASIEISFACGEQLRRSDTYLDHSRVATNGRMCGQRIFKEVHMPSLNERQQQIELASSEKRSKQKPRSDQFDHEQIRSVVASLEMNFGGYGANSVVPTLDSRWKQDAIDKTISEAPRLPPSGTEINALQSLYGQPDKPNNASESLRRLCDPRTGKWLGSVEVRERLVQENPSLRRAGALTNASGRYSNELVVPGGRTKATNKTIPTLKAENLDDYLQKYTSSEKLVIVACLRPDDRKSRQAEAVLEQIETMVSLQGSSGDAFRPNNSNIRGKYVLVKCDLAESKLLLQRYRVTAAPTFLMFYDRQLVHVSSFGGESLRVFPATTNANLSAIMDRLPRVLLVEKCSKAQIWTERILRKEGFQWELAITGEQAVAHYTRVQKNGISDQGPVAINVNKIPSSSGAHGIIILSDKMSDNDVNVVDRLLRRTSGTKTVVCAIISETSQEIIIGKSMCDRCMAASGKNSEITIQDKKRRPTACPHCGIVSNVNGTVLASPSIMGLADDLVYKHIKSTTLHRLCEKVIDQEASTHPPLLERQHIIKHVTAKAHHTGLTFQSFTREIDAQWTLSRSGQKFPLKLSPPIALSTHESVLPVTTRFSNQVRSKLF